MKVSTEVTSAESDIANKVRVLKGIAVRYNINMRAKVIPLAERFQSVPKNKLVYLRMINQGLYTRTMF